MIWKRKSLGEFLLLTSYAEQLEKPVSVTHPSFGSQQTQAQSWRTKQS